ncbi:MAG TPA: RNA-binding cell elongation regulator Jag/EloR [Clostridia bacterium]|nr:RNA-binding cell elongation regulator Jag/EloR [Clostridia bacterium]
MSKTIISEGKTTNDAIEKGLKELGLTKNDVEINVIEASDKRSFFDILAPRIVKVELKIKENNSKNPEEKQIEKRKEIYNNEDIELDENTLINAKNKIEVFINSFLRLISDKDFNYSIKIQNSKIYIDITGEDAGILIGYRGESMNSLQNIITSVANKESESRVKIFLDIEGYREKRIKVLEELAVKVSKIVLKNGKSITLEPMSAYERKIIHSKLQENELIKTHSVDEEPYRKIVISKN